MLMISLPSLVAKCGCTQSIASSGSSERLKILVNRPDCSDLPTLGGPWIESISRNPFGPAAASMASCSALRTLFVRPWMPEMRGP